MEKATWQSRRLEGNESAARDWEKRQLAKGHEGGPGGTGWRYGYWYTINKTTLE